MTMPHLMNCPHSEDGWCLACVKTMHEEHERRHTKHKESEAMNQATKQEWRLVINGADRSDLSSAFRMTKWEKTWYDHSSLFDDSDTDSGYIVSLPIQSINDLAEALMRVAHLQATYGIALHGIAHFGELRFNYSLCTNDSPFEVSSCTLSRYGKPLKSEINSRVSDAEKALADLRLLLAENGIQQS